MKTPIRLNKATAGIVILLTIGSTLPLLMSIKRDRDLDALPIETYDQAGHTWELRHSPECKCKDK